jgi:hypothetical protein
MTAPPAIAVRVMGYERLYLRDFEPKNGVYKYTDPYSSKGFPGLELMFDVAAKAWVAVVDGKWKATADEADKAVEYAIEAAAFDCLLRKKEHQQ